MPEQPKGPTVTVVMTVYNAGAYVAQAIESILSQTYYDFEFLILNDGSTDNSAAVIRSFDDSRIRFYDDVENKGVVWRWNQGLQLSRGRYQAIQAADDISYPDRLAKQVAYLDGHPEVGLVGSWYHTLDAQGEVLAGKKLPVDGHDIAFQLLFNNCFCAPSVMARTALIRQVGGYGSTQRLAEDYALWVKMSRVCSLVNLPDYLVGYRVHRESLSKQQTTALRQQALEIATQSVAALTGEKPSEVVLLPLMFPRQWQGDTRVLGKSLRLLHTLYSCYVTERQVPAHHPLAIQTAGKMAAYFKRLGWLRRMAFLLNNLVPVTWFYGVHSCRYYWKRWLD